MTTSPAIPADLLARLSADIFGDADLLARLPDVPMTEWPRYADCWTCSVERVRVNGSRTLVRYVLFAHLRGFRFPNFPALVRTCPTPGCVNPVHHTESRKPRRGRRPGRAPARVAPPKPQPRHVPSLPLLWPDAQTLLDLLLRPFSKWPVELEAECWEWAGPLFTPKRGLPVPRLGRRTGSAVLWELFNRQPVPKGQVVRRTCRNHLCVNPKHGELMNRANPWLDRPVQNLDDVPAHLLDEDLASRPDDEAREVLEYWLTNIHAPTLEETVRFLLGQEEMRSFRRAALALDAPELRQILPQLGWEQPP